MVTETEKKLSKNIVLTPKEELAFQLLTSEEDSNVMYGGSKGGGKSFLLCVWARYWAKHLANIFGIEERLKDPLAVGFIGRARAIDFKKTTLETWKRTFPPQAYAINKSEQEITIDGKVKLLYGGLDSETTINKFNSQELAFFCLDQAEETQRTEVNILRASLRLTYNGVKPSYKEFYSTNPAECWLKEDFIDNLQPRNHFVPALPTDNPHLPEGYIERLRTVFRHSPELLRAYLYGDWTALSASNTLITMTMLNELKNVLIYKTEIKRVVACDPSTGGDECVIDFLENGEILDQKILHNERDTMKVAGEMVVMAEKHSCSSYAVDVIGIGKGVTDRLREMKPNARVIGINSAERSENPERFTNVKAEIWWYVMEQVRERKIAYVQDEETRRQIINMRFKVVNSNGKILLEPKEEAKKRLGTSPDRADAWAYGIWSLQYADIVKKDAWRESLRPASVSSRVRSAMVA